MPTGVSKFHLILQLQGDTVNTASRMETNGVNGRIHCSQATADALIAKGKAHWLTPREDKIVAKGKGEMQTYFVNSRGDGKENGSVITSSSCMSGRESQHGGEEQDDIGEEDKGTGKGDDDEIEVIGEKLKNRLYTIK